MIPIDEYKKIISTVPIVCVDILLKLDNKYLLVKRKNNPLAGEWWVVGGRLNAGESAVEACARKVRQEVGLNISNFIFKGVYEDQFDCNAFESKPYHTISLVFESELEASQNPLLDDQSDDWGYFDKLPDRFSYRVSGE